MKPFSWKRLLLCVLILVEPCSSRLFANQDQIPVSSSSNGPSQPTNTTMGNPSGTTPDKSPTKTPGIYRIIPGAPLLEPNQPLALTGSNFQDKVKVKFTDSEGNSCDANILNVSPDRLVVAASFAASGSWTATVINPDGAQSSPLKFQVANSPMPEYSWRVRAFVGTAVIVTILLIALFVSVSHALNKAQKNNQWSLGDALSEESVYQPKEIRQKSDIVLLASSSRLIALSGLLAILTIVVGIGYAVMWSLFIFGTVPDLGQVRLFLYGAACLFAPYLANQLSGVFSGVKPAATSIEPSARITGMVPASPGVANVEQTVHLTGENFQSGTTMTLVDPAGQASTVSNTAIENVLPTAISVNLNLPVAGSWKVILQPPVNQLPASYIFMVSGPPIISDLTPKALSSKEEQQELTFTGKGFISGLTVGFTLPSGTKTSCKPTAVTATVVKVNVAVTKNGAWEFVLTNPGGYSSDPYPITVS